MVHRVVRWRINRSHSVDKSGLSSAPRPTDHNQHPTTATELYNGREETPKGGRDGEGADCRPDVGSSVHAEHTLVKDGSSHSSRPYRTSYIHAIKTDCTAALNITEVRLVLLASVINVQYARSRQAAHSIVYTICVSEISNALQNLLLITRRNHSACQAAFATTLGCISAPHSTKWLYKRYLSNPGEGEIITRFYHMH